MSRERIEHEGRIASIGRDFITVEIISRSACTACHAKSMCGVSDMAVKVVEIAQDMSTLAGDYRVGDTVNVVMSPTMGVKAVWLAYVLPLIVLMLTILILSLLKFDELKTGLGALGVTALYYAVVFMFRKKISRTFIFTIEKQAE